jgi:polyphosphate kinase
VNGLADNEVVRALYRAAEAGVVIDLIVRGICTLRPSTPESGQLRVTSVVGRWLEHSRIYRFHNDGASEYFVGSSDLRPRNLRRRVELLVPVPEAGDRAALDRVLELYLTDATGWELTADGRYHQHDRASSGAQDALALLLAR